MRPLALALLATLLLACTGDTPATPSPSPSPTPTAEVTATPTPRPTPEETPTSVPTASPTPVDRTRSLETVDQVIAAVETGDVDTLESLIRYTSIPCDGEDYFVGPPYPPCDGEALATPIDAFPASICQAVWHRNPRPMLDRFAHSAGPLVAVIEGPDRAVDYGVPFTLDRPSGDYRIVFAADLRELTAAYEAVIEDRGLIALRMGCNVPSDAIYANLDPPPSIVRQGPAFDFAQPTPVPTQLPNAVLAPYGNLTGIHRIDAILSAMDSRDPNQITPLLQETSWPCTHAPDIGSVICGDDDLEMTIVDAFLHTSCEGWWSRDGLDGIAEQLAGWEAPLFAVAETSYRGWYQILYANQPVTELGGRVLLRRERPHHRHRRGLFHPRTMGDVAPHHPPRPRLAPRRPVADNAP